jgi:hypothetical protein
MLHLPYKDTPVKCVSLQTDQPVLPYVLQQRAASGVRSIIKRPNNFKGVFL